VLSVPNCIVWHGNKTALQVSSSHASYARLTVTAGKQKNSSGDEIANVNFLYDDIVHEVQNTIDSCINSATDRRGCVGTQDLPNSIK